MFGGEWLDRIIGLENVTVETVMARAPDGSEMFEVVRFHSPSAGAGELAPAANRPGLRHAWKAPACAKRLRPTRACFSTNAAVIGA